MTTLSVALVQLDLLDAAPSRNLGRALELMQSAPGSHLYLLPELWTTGYAHDSWADTADNHTPSIVETLAQAAAGLRAWVGGSMISRNDASRLVNRFWLLPPDGGAPMVYDKAHLFGPMQEDRYLAAGSRRERSPLGPFNAALSVCFDLRFPEQYRLDAVAGANLFLVVAEWPAARAEALRLFARARAAENQGFLLLCNRAGTGADGTRFGGGSAAISPSGEVLAEAGDGEQVLRAELDPAKVDAARSALEVLGARVPGVDH
jgi:predicted amidohydrolase